MALTPADRLRAAADIIEHAADAATEGTWAPHVQLWNPDTARHAAALIREAAKIEDDVTPYLNGQSSRITPFALPLAEAILDGKPS